MVNRLKEEEHSERAIRNLVKLPENRRCINCNNLGPQYVCATFLTFVCSNCSGVHREFTHRIKSISMAKFSEEEVSALQAGGNDRARQIYFKEWDPQRHSYPDSSNLHRLRDFIKNVYVNRKYSGERSTDTLPRLRLNEKESSNEGEKDYRGGLRSPRSENKYERHHGEVYCSGGRSGRTSSRYYYDERRSPRYSVENSRYGGSRRSFGHIEIVDDRIRDDGYQSRRLSKREPTLVTESPENQNKSKTPGSPVTCSLKNVLRETVPQTQLVEDAKPNAGDSGPKRPSQDSLEGSSVKNKECVSKGLIDFSVNSEPVVVAASSQSQQNLSSKVDTNWDPFESSVKEAAPRSQVPATKTLEELLFELSVPSHVGPNTDDNILVGSGGIMSTGDATLTELDMTSVEVPGLGAKMKETDGDFPVQSSDGTTVQAVSIRNGKTTVNIVDEQQLPSVQQQAPVASATDFPVQSSDGITVQTVSMTDGETTENIADGKELQSIQQQTSIASSTGSTPEKTTLPVGGLNFESQMSSLASHSEGSSSPSTVSSVVVSQPAQAAHQCSSEETKSIGRRELPADLFTVNFSPAGWHIGSYPTMGYNLHYRPNMMPVQSFANSSRSTNPFDLNDEASLQGALPQSFHSAGIQTHYPGLMASQSNVFSIPPGPPSFAALSLSPYMTRQQVHNGLLPLSRVEANGAPEASTIAPLSLNATYSTPTPGNPSSLGGNPFG